MNLPHPLHHRTPPRFPTLLAAITTILLLTCLTPLSSAQNPNHVLTLDGDGDFVELPADAFSDLGSATIEIWAKWDGFQPMSRVFDFLLQGRFISIHNRYTTPDLWAESLLPAVRLSLQNPGMLQPGEWVHLALSVQPESMQLYFNGQPLSTSLVSDPNSFRSVEFTRQNLLGRSNARLIYDNQDFLGQIDNLRVWDHTRTADQIRSNMATSLTGNEPGLVALLDFEHVADGVVQDRTTNNIDGHLLGNATVTPAQLPDPADLPQLDRTLALPGDGSYIELPPNLFDHLADATTEGWVNWSNPDGRKPFFSFGANQHEIYVSSWANSRLKLLVTGADGERHRFEVPGLLEPNSWHHVAAVTGSGGMKLYFDGRLVASDPFTGSFADLEGTTNYLGKSHQFNSPVTLDGRIADFRVWDTARTAQEIRATMFDRLTGDEPALVANWKLDSLQNGQLTDSGPGGHHATLVGNASVIAARLPSREQMPSRIYGTIVDAKAQLASGAIALLVQDGLVKQQTTANASGNYKFELPRSQSVQVFAVLRGEVSQQPDVEVGPFEASKTDLQLAPADTDPRTTRELRDTLIASLHDSTFLTTGLATALVELGISDPDVVSSLVGSLSRSGESARETTLESLEKLPVPDPLDQVFQKRSQGMALLIVGLLIPLVGFHLVLFFFFPQAHSNLYYALFVAAAALPHLVKTMTADSPMGDDQTMLVDTLTAALIALSGLRLVYSLFYPKLPRLYWVFFGLIVTTGIALAVNGVHALDAFSGGNRPPAFPAFAVTLAILAGIGLSVSAAWIEMLRAIIVAIVRKKKGAWMIGLGLLSILVFILFPPLAYLLAEETFNRFVTPSIQPYLGQFGIVAFVAWTSIFLAGQFAQMNIDLTAVKAEIESQNKNLQLAQQAADDANQAKSAFLANMSHELRTPLNAIIGYSEMVGEELDDLGAGELKPDLEKVVAAAKHQLGLVNDILDISKIEAGKMTLYLEDFDIPTLIAEVASTVQPLVTKNSNKLTVDCPHDIGTMHADQTKVRQALFNLLSNASKFTEKGTITLKVRRTAPPTSDSRLPTSVTFQVTDTGIGMTAEQLGKLFQAFTQADASTTRKFGGTGLGLTISKQFCHMMGGDLTVTSTEAKGSTFTITLPTAVDDPALPPEIPAETNPSPSSTGPLVLVIDDDPDMRNLTTRALTRDGYRVECAPDGKTGLAMAKGLKPSVITLDVMMPGLDGWAVLTSLKDDPDTTGIPVIMLTIIDEEHVGFSLGASGYLTKPVDWEKLANTIGKFRTPGSGGTDILVVEDDTDTRQLLTRALKKDGWSVHEAENGKVALELANATTPALVLLDLMMPELDGFGFMEGFRKIPACHHVPVIVITAKDITPEDRQRLNGEVTRILQKATHSTEELLAEIRSLVKPKSQPAPTERGHSCPPPPPTP